MFCCFLQNSHPNLPHYNRTNSMGHHPPSYKRTDPNGGYRDYNQHYSSHHRQNHNISGESRKFDNMRDPELKQVQI